MLIGLAEVMPTLLIFLVGEVTFFCLNEFSDFWLIRHQCNPKALVKVTVSQGATRIAFYCIYV